MPDLKKSTDCNLVFFRLLGLDDRPEEDTRAGSEEKGREENELILRTIFFFSRTRSRNAGFFSFFHKQVAAVAVSSFITFI